MERRLTAMHFVEKYVVWSQRFLNTGDPHARHVATLCLQFAEEIRDGRQEARSSQLEERPAR